MGFLNVDNTLRAHNGLKIFLQTANPEPCLKAVQDWTNTPVKSLGIGISSLQNYLPLKEATADMQARHAVGLMLLLQRSYSYVCTVVVYSIIM